MRNLILAFLLPALASCASVPTYTGAAFNNMRSENIQLGFVDAAAQRDALRTDNRFGGRAGGEALEGVVKGNSD